jgi:amidase
MSDPHPPSAQFAFSSATQMLQQLASGERTSLQIVEILLSRIEAIDAPGTAIGLNSVAAIASDARAVAQERDEERARGESRGPLHGLPVLIKDNVEAIGLPGLAGSTALVGRPSRDAALVTRIRDAGAIVLASTNLSEWANIRSPRSTSGFSSSAGLVANPWALDRSAGGSSSGSGAAIAAGLAPLAIGTETDGSIVCPASVNGVVGLKPTVGVVPTTHVVPISASQDSPGPMARTVDDVALLYGVLSQSAAPASSSHLNVAVSSNWRTGHPLTDQLFTDTVEHLRAAGMNLTDRELALPGQQEFMDEGEVLFSELFDDFTVYLSERPGDGVKSLADVIAYEDEHSEQELRFFGHENFITSILSGGRGGPNYEQARQRNLTWAIDTCLIPALEGVDVVIAPAFGPSWKSDLTVGGHPGPSSCATMAPAIAGWPILCLPFGVVEDLPVGLAIIGRANSEWVVIEAARQIELAIQLNNPWPRPLWKQASRG